MRLSWKQSAAMAALAIGGVGAASATEGWYIRGDVGYSFESQYEFDNGFSRTLDDDWMGAIGLGYAYSNGVRLEAELSYRQNEVPSYSPPADFTATALMANVFYDFNRGGAYEPYIGAGVGWLQSDIDNNTGGEIEIDDSFAWQLLAGVAFSLSDRLDLDVGYRYFVANGVESTQAGSPLSDRDITHQAVTLGLRWQFAAPPPPPPPPAPPPPPPPPPVVVCPAADFVVYFEWDRSNLNQAALETIDAAVERARSCNLGAVSVVGHTDTSGSPQYNLGLSQRRASVVADALVARGIPSGAISLDARGETDLARATRDGVREPLNRRTAVVISFR